MNGTEKFVALAAGGAVIAFFVNQWLENHVAPSSTGKIAQGTQEATTSSGEWTPIGSQPANSLAQQSEVWRGPGNQQSNSSFNGQIFTKRFNKGGNHNSTVNYERSHAFQSWTKNPFANGTNNSYAYAVANATQDPTNQATALVLGPGVAPNND